MTCQTVEQGRAKCHHYWPENDDAADEGLGFDESLTIRKILEGVQIEVRSDGEPIWLAEHLILRKFLLTDHTLGIQDRQIR